MQDCLSDILHMPHVLSHVKVHTCAFFTHGRLAVLLPIGTQLLHMAVCNDVHAKSAMHLWGLQALGQGTSILLVAIMYCCRHASQSWPPPQQANRLDGAVYCAANKVPWSLVSAVSVGLTMLNSRIMSVPCSFQCPAA